jgi:hypothetical protein
LVATVACSIETPASGAPNKYAQYVRRFSKPLNTALHQGRHGQRHEDVGDLPSVVPLNPRGATPTTVMAWPLTTSVLLRIAGLSFEACCQ